MIKIKSAKFFKNVKVNKDPSILLIDCENNKNDKEAYFIPEIGLVCNRWCERDKEITQFIVPVNNIESLTPYEKINFPVLIGLGQKELITKGSFSKYAKEEIKEEPKQDEVEKSKFCKKK